MDYSICQKPRAGKRAALYARFSSHNQRSESIEIQLDNGFTYCDTQDLDVVAIYRDEAKSGRTSDRADFQRMLEDARHGLFDYVVIYKVTRIMRNRDEMALARIMLRKCGVEILYAGEQIGGGSAGVLQLGMLEVLAEWESAQLAERIRDGIAKNAERCMANGQPLYGWDIVDGFYEINETEAAVLRRAKDMVLDGKSVADAVLVSRGHLTKRGKPITHNNMTKMLKRKQNAGVYSYAGYEQEDGMPALWSMEEQRMLWRKLGEDKSPKGKGSPADFVLTGKLWCGDCDRPMSGTSGTGKSGRVYYYYQDRKGCGRKVRKDDIEHDVAETVRQELAKASTREKIAALMVEYESESDGPKQSDLIRQELHEIELTYARIWEAIEKGIAPPGGKERIDELKARQETLDEELAVAESVEAVRLDADRVLFWLEKAAAQEDDRTLIELFVTRVYLFGDDLHIVMAFDDNAESFEADADGGRVRLNVPKLHHKFYDRQH
jgi:site-specific DNA recombinase